MRNKDWRKWMEPQGFIQNCPVCQYMLHENSRRRERHKRKTRTYKWFQVWRKILICRCNEHHVKKKKTPKKNKTKPRHSSELGTAREPWFSFQHGSQRLHFHSVCDDDQKEILFLSFPTSQHRKTACGLREHVTFNMGKNIAQCIIILAL